MSRFNKIIITTIFLSLCLPLWVNAKLVVYSFEEMVLKSSSIIIGEVQSISGGFIRSPRAKVKVIRQVKGIEHDSIIELLHGDPTLSIFPNEGRTKLKEKHHYILFLQRSEDSYRLVAANAAKYEIDEKGQICDDGTMVPTDKIIDSILAVILKANKGTTKK